MANLLSLPTELLLKVVDSTHPGSLVSFAVTNRKIYAVSFPALQTHRGRRSTLRVVHDRNPINVPSVLRSIISEPSLAWYIRHLEIWELRQNFSMWTSSTFVTGNRFFDEENFRDWPEKHYNYSHLDLSYYDEDELQQIRNHLLHTLHLSDARVQLWMTRLESGCDEPLKVLLMALSSRLNKVTFVQYSSGRTLWIPDEHPLRLLSTSLRGFALHPELQWPCFQSLTEVTVGYQHNLRHPTRDNYYPTSHTVAPLLMLPRIKKLALNMMLQEKIGNDSDTEDEDDKPYTWEWGPYISTCQDLRFYCCTLALETMQSFLAGIKALRSFECTDACPSQKEIVFSLLKHAKSSLENLNLEMDPIPCNISDMKGFETLRRLEVIDRLLIDPTTFKDTQCIYDDAGYPDLNQCTYGITDWIDLVASLPDSLETIRIRSRPKNLFEYEVQGLLSRLSQLVAAKSSDCFPNLREICIANLPSWFVNLQSPRRVPEFSIMTPVNLGPWILDLRKACEAKNIALHSCNPGDFNGKVTCPSCDLFQPGEIESLPKYSCEGDSPVSSPLET